MCVKRADLRAAFFDQIPRLDSLNARCNCTTTFVNVISVPVLKSIIVLGMEIKGKALRFRYKGQYRLAVQPPKPEVKAETDMMLHNSEIHYKFLRS